MKIEITKGSKAGTPLADFFAAPLSVEGEAELLDLRFVDELLAFMKEQGISRSELARRTGIRPSRITAMLSGSNNFTTETKVRAARAVGAKYHHCLAPASHQVRWQSLPPISFLAPQSAPPEVSSKVAETEPLPASRRVKGKVSGKA